MSTSNPLTQLEAMKKHEFHLQLPDFEGPIDLLLALIQEKEIHAENIPLVTILEQFLEESDDDIDVGAEFIASASSLLLLKSRSLLPDELPTPDEERESSVNKQEAIKALIEYVKFKKAGEELCVMDKELSSVFKRGHTGDQERPRPLGLESLSLDDLGALFKELIEKRGEQHFIFEEEWRVSDKIVMIKKVIAVEKRLSFFSLFLENQSKHEWIVTFLAILELMKLGLIQAKKDDLEIYIIGNTHEGN